MLGDSGEAQNMRYNQPDEADRTGKDDCGDRGYGCSEKRKTLDSADRYAERAGFDDTKRQRIKSRSECLCQNQYCHKN